jgi:chromatin modification-related protein EAF6
MAENAAPGSANNAGADNSRGMPYYERLRRDLRESLNKKRLIDHNLVSAGRLRVSELCLTIPV